MLKIVEPKQYTERDLNIIHLASLLNPEIEKGIAFEQAQEIVDIYAERGESNYANALVTLFNTAMKPPERVECKLPSQYLHDKSLLPNERLILMHLESLPSLKDVKSRSTAEALGLSLTTVYRLMRELRRKGYLTTSRIEFDYSAGLDITLTTK